MDEKLNKQSVDRLDISDNCMELLKSNDIETIGQLCKKSKTDLKKSSPQALAALHKRLAEYKAKKLAGGSTT